MTADQPLLDVVEEGLVRIFATSEDGREASLSYYQSGQLYGFPTVYRLSPHAQAQMVARARLLRLDVAHFLDLFEEDAEIPRALVRFMAGVVVQYARTVTVRTLGSMRERLAYDLIERACHNQLRTGSLKYEVTHEELAAGIGSAREVVSPILADLRRAGIVQTEPGHVEVRDPERLYEVVRGLIG